MLTLSTAATMTLDGGNVCLDFINSGYHQLETDEAERLHTYADFLLLARRLDLISASWHDDLLQLATQHPQKAAAVLSKARKIRTALYNLFTTRCDADPDGRRTGNLRVFNAALQDMWKQRKLTFEDGRYQSAWKHPKPHLEHPLLQLVLAAYSLLASRAQHDVKQCQGCLWLFLDQSKNHSRRWCDMQSCGSLVKSRRYYQRKKADGAAKQGRTGKAAK
ncbi:CGNR zinc finger domain-containing protein [Pedobacter yulinensis]|nr:CGNR zinc finger domain-containing protein [Pedobacter yulinensis]